jgi:phosphoglycolate phosphatase
MSSGELADATIVFDLDGTLVDTAPDIIRALNETMDLEGLPRVKPETVRNLIGHGARVLIERASALHGVTFSATRLDQLTNEFVAFYAADIARDSRPFDGVLDAMDTLSSLGAKLSVCTNKRTALSVQLLDALNMSERFSAIVGADAVTDRKPHPGSLPRSSDARGWCRAAFCYGWRWRSGRGVSQGGRRTSLYRQFRI